MSRLSSHLLTFALLWLLPVNRTQAAPPPSLAGYGSKSCSTFLLSKGDAQLVGHNLDESIEVPGMILVNPRGMAKTSLSFKDMMAIFGSGKDTPRTSWISKYGSIVYSTCGREFIDGGMNEAGFYVGEMTLLGSQYPDDSKLVKIYHHAWMQYLLDNFSSVPEAIESLSQVVPDGHCQWHFFVADREGRSALIEFEKKQTRIYTGTTLPLKAATNFRYAVTLNELASFEGFGGKRSIDWTFNPKDDLRHVWAAAMLRRFEQAEGPAGPEQAFELLKQMWCKGNRWSLVFDLKSMRVHWNTYRCRTTRFVDFSAFDFSPKAKAMALDVHRELSGDTRSAFQPLALVMEQEAVKQFWSGVDVGFMGNLFWKPRVVRAMCRHQRTLSWN